MTQEKAEKGAAELLEDLKKRPDIPPGIEPVKVLKPRQFIETDPKTAVYVPFAPGSDFKPATAYVDAVKKIAKPGIDDDYLLLASVRMLSDIYKAKSVLDFKHYTHQGITDKMSEEQAGKQTADNLKTNQKTLETMVRNVDTAWTDPITPAFITPGDVFFTYDDATNVLPDDEHDSMLKNSVMVQQFVFSNGSEKDRKDYAAGKRFYVARYKDAETKDGKKGLAFDHVEVWRKKE